MGGRTVLSRSGRVYSLLESDEAKEQETLRDAPLIGDKASATSGDWDNDAGRLGIGCGGVGMLCGGKSHVSHVFGDSNSLILTEDV
mmetsp:Transcript_195/g.478  ORF Transcript_195/g.478 Transcript_195/m.478 type:complete len:86 (-) Transcript_195:507-764(-)